MPDFLADLLTRPGAGDLCLALKTARLWGGNRRPMDYIAPGLIPTFDPQRLAKLNRNLEMAWQLLEDESCPNCGVPSWLGHSTLSDIDFHVTTTTCYGCMAEADYKSTHKDLPDGAVIHVQAVMVEKDTPMVTRIEGIKSFPEPQSYYTTTDDEE
jgi:hypothetical protein